MQAQMLELASYWQAKTLNLELALVESLAKACVGCASKIDATASCLDSLDASPAFGSQTRWSIDDANAS